MMRTNLIFLAGVIFGTWLTAGCVGTGSKELPSVITPTVGSYTQTTTNSTHGFGLNDNSIFSKYDRALIDRIQARWHAILDQQKNIPDKTGKLVVYFKLYSDGTVSDLTIKTNQVGKLLGNICVETIQKSAPFGHWPPDMERKFGRDSRELTFTFYYE